MNDQRHHRFISRTMIMIKTVTARWMSMLTYFKTGSFRGQSLISNENGVLGNVSRCCESDNKTTTLQSQHYNSMFMKLNMNTNHNSPWRIRGKTSWDNLEVIMSITTARSQYRIWLTQLNSTENYGRRCLTPPSTHHYYLLSKTNNIT